MQPLVELDLPVFPLRTLCSRTASNYCILLKISMPTAFLRIPVIRRCLSSIVCVGVRGNTKGDLTYHAERKFVLTSAWLSKCSSNMRPRRTGSTHPTILLEHFEIRNHYLTWYAIHSAASKTAVTGSLRKGGPIRRV